MSRLPRFSLARSLLTSVEYNELRDGDDDDEQRIHREPQNAPVIVQTCRLTRQVSK